MSKQIDEVMGLVDSLSEDCIAAGIAQMAGSESAREQIAVDVRKGRADVESKLRELLPEGFVLVPTEPTEEMGLVYLQAARIHAADGAEDTMRFSYGGYKAMITAAKKAPE